MSRLDGPHTEWHTEYLTDKTHPCYLTGHAVDMKDHKAEGWPRRYQGVCLEPDCGWEGERTGDEFDAWGEAEKHNWDTAKPPYPARRRLVTYGEWETVGVDHKRDGSK